MSSKNNVLVTLGVAGAVVGTYFIAKMKAGINFVPASEASSIGASSVVGSEVAVSGNSTYTDAASLQKYAKEQPTITMSIDNTAMSITIAGAPSGSLIQVYNLQSGQLLFNLNGNGTLNFSPALAAGQYIAVVYETGQASNIVTIG